MEDIAQLKITGDEYSQIDHYYIYLLLKKSPNKENAIYDM